MNPNLFFAPEYVALPPRLLLPYALLRADIEFGHTPAAQLGQTTGQRTSGITSVYLAKRLGISPESAFMFLTELVTRRVIKRVPTAGEPLWELGTPEQWYLEVPIPEPPRGLSPSQSVMKHLESSQEHMAAKEARAGSALPKELQRQVVTKCIKAQVVCPEDIARLRRCFIQEHTDTFGVPPKDPEGVSPKSSIRTYADRMLEYAGGDITAALDAMRWAFANWDRLVAEKIVEHGVFTWNSLGSKKLWSEMAIVRFMGWNKYAETMKPTALPIRDIMTLFDKTFQDRWGYRPTSLAYVDDDWASLTDAERRRVYAAKMAVFSRFVSYLDNDRELCVKLVTYLFARWDEFSDAMDVMVPDYLLLNSEKFAHALKHWHETGTVPKKREESTADRGRS